MFRFVHVGRAVRIWRDNLMLQLLTTALVLLTRSRLIAGLSVTRWINGILWATWISTLRRRTKNSAGRHLDKARPEWMSEPVINLTFSTIETILPILTDNKPQISVVPFEPDDIEIATVLSEIVKANWDYNDMDIKLHKLVKNTLIFGNGFLKVDWDPAARNGTGDVRMSIIDPDNVVVDPNGVDDETIQWIAHIQNVPKEYIVHNPNWAHLADQIGSGTYDSNYTVIRGVPRKPTAVPNPV